MSETRRSDGFMEMYLEFEAVQALDFGLTLTKGDRVRAMKRLKPSQRALIRTMTPIHQHEVRRFLDEIHNGRQVMTLEELFTR